MERGREAGETGVGNFRSDWSLRIADQISRLYTPCPKRVIKHLTTACGIVATIAQVAACCECVYSLSHIAVSYSPDSFQTGRLRTMLNINPQNKKMILSIDGGGVRGIITVAMLAELERQTGKTCAEMFDMVAGTSTGAVIAAGIGLGISAADLLKDVYRTRLPQAFQSQPKGVLLYLKYLFGGLRNLYDLQPFIDSLAPFSHGKTIKDFSKPIVFMTTRDVRTANTYYIVSKGPGAGRFAD